MLRIVPGDLDDPQILELIATHVASARAETPSESAHALDIAELKSGDINFWAAWDDHRLLAIGALKQLSGREGEVKSMHTAQSVRRNGAGSAMLAHLIKTALAAGMKRISLETGSSEYFLPARTFYEKHGFKKCAPFADYVPDRHSVFMTLAL